MTTSRAREMMSRSMVVLLACLGFAGAATAAPLILFDDAVVSGGSLTYDGEGGPLVGTSIVLDTIIGTGTPLNDAVPLDCVACSLELESGNNALEGPPNWIWNGGGFFAVLGTVMDGATKIVDSDVILSGVLTGAGASQNGSNLIAFGLGDDQKNQALLDFYGVVEVDFVFEFALDAPLTTGSIQTNGGFDVDVSEVLITNTRKVPEPGTLSLVGVLLMLGLGMRERRRRTLR